MSGVIYPPSFLRNPLEWCRRLSECIFQIMQGKTDNTGAVTLTANSATTTLTEASGRIGQNTVILFMPTTANAAAAMTNLYVSSRSVANNTFTLTHTNNAQVDRIFNYVLIGG